MNRKNDSKKYSNPIPQKKNPNHLLLEYAGVGFAFIASLVVFAPIYLSYIRYLFRLTGNPNPGLGWAETILSDSIRVASGVFPLGDPNNVPVGQLYGLGYPLFNGMLLKIYPWAGWTLAVNLFSVLIGVSISTYLAVRFVKSLEGAHYRKMIVALTIASTFSGISLIALALPRTNLLFEGRTDHFAWVITILGIVLVSTKIHNRYFQALSIFLMTYGFHSKFTVLPLIIALFVVAEFMTKSFPEERQKFRKLFLIFLATNLIVTIGFEILSGGWFLKLTLFLPLNHTRTIPTIVALREIFALFAILSVLFAITFIKNLTPKKGSTLNVFRSDALLLNSFILSLFVMVPLAILARMKQGGADNQYIGIIWIVIFCSAIYIGGNKTMSKGVGPRVLTSVTLLSLFVVFLPTGMYGSSGTNLRNSIRIEANKVLPPSGMRNFTSAAASPTTELYFYSPYAATRSFEKSDQNPLLVNIVDLLAAGYQPKWFFEKISEGKINTKDLFDVGHSEYYASAYGLQDFGTLSALNKFGLTRNDKKQLLSCTEVIMQKHIRLVRIDNQGFLCNLKKQTFKNNQAIFDLKVEESSKDYWIRLDSEAKGKVTIESQTKLNYVTVGREIYTPGTETYLDAINTYLSSPISSCERNGIIKIMIDMKKTTTAIFDSSGRIVCTHKFKSSDDLYLGISKDVKIALTP